VWCAQSPARWPLYSSHPREDVPMVCVTMRMPIPPGLRCCPHDAAHTMLPTARIVARPAALVLRSAVCCGVQPVAECSRGSSVSLGAHCALEQHLEQRGELGSVGSSSSWLVRTVHARHIAGRGGQIDWGNISAQCSGGLLMPLVYDTQYPGWLLMLCRLGVGLLRAEPSGQSPDTRDRGPARAKPPRSGAPCVPPRPPARS
jgi:hypothetical protein